MCTLCFFREQQAFSWFVVPSTGLFLPLIKCTDNECCHWTNDINKAFIFAQLFLMDLMKKDIFVHIYFVVVPCITWTF